MNESKSKGGGLIVLRCFQTCRFSVYGPAPHEQPQWNANANDTLKAVTLYHWLEGCL